MNTDQATGNPEGVMGLLLRLRGLGLTDADFAKLIESVPHQNFVPVEYFDKAWADLTLPLKCGQNLTSPDILARMLAAAQIDQRHTVLEIGTGSGYLTALIAKCCRKVRSVERYSGLIADAKSRLQALGIDNVTLDHADGNVGGANNNLYDRIICDSAFTDIPRHLADQLVAGGTVIAAIGEPLTEQMLVKFTKIGNRFDREDLFPVRFCSLEAGKAAFL